MKVVNQEKVKNYILCPRPLANACAVCYTIYTSLHMREKHMKKLLSFLLAICLCLSCGVLLAGCGGIGENTSAPRTVGVKDGWRLPTTMKAMVDGAVREIDWTWTENTCTFTVEDTTFLFTYDQEARALSLSITGGAKEQMDRLCTFDIDGRISSISFAEQTMMKILYPGEHMSVQFWDEGALGSPVDVTPNWTDSAMLMPPFDDPADRIFFTEWGDLYMGEDTELYFYEYDDNGNVLAVSPADTSDLTFEFFYGEEAMTAAWQRVPLKLMLTWSLGRPMAVFAMDMMCYGAYQQHSYRGQSRA